MDNCWFTVKQLSEYIGLSERSIRTYVFRGLIPYRKPNGRILFSRKEIDRWLEASPGLKLSSIEKQWH
jgi:excisionase family DNA binding protein